MAKAFQFEFLLHRAIDKRELAAQGIGDATQRLQQAQARQQQIETFRAEYRVRLTDTASRGMRVHQWNDFQLFLAKLDAAVDQQIQEVLKHALLLEQAKQLWRECEKEVKAYEALRERHEARQAAVAVRTEQRQSDEWAANLARRGRSEYE
jgi:flagellar FliJ protein